MHDCDMTLPNFTHLLYGVGKPNTKIFFFLFLNYNTVLSDSTPENFANIWQIKGKWIRSSKFERKRIHFLSEFSDCCHPEILLSRKRDVRTSPLYTGHGSSSSTVRDSTTEQFSSNRDWHSSVFLIFCEGHAITDVLKQWWHHAARSKGGWFYPTFEQPPAWTAYKSGLSYL